MLGDIDFDTYITAADALSTLRMSVGIDTTDRVKSVVADVDFDEDITANDALVILRFSVGVDVDAPIGENV